MPKRSVNLPSDAQVSVVSGKYIEFLRAQEQLVADYFQPIINRADPDELAALAAFLDSGVCTTEVVSASGAQKYTFFGHVRWAVERLRSQEHGDARPVLVAKEG